MLAIVILALLCPSFFAILSTSFINVPCTLTEFDENTFENFVEKIVVGEVLQNGKKDPNVIRFILKTGSEFKIALTSQDVKAQNLSFGSQQRTI